MWDHGAACVEFLDHVPLRTGANASVVVYQSRDRLYCVEVHYPRQVGVLGYMKDTKFSWEEANQYRKVWTASLRCGTFH